MSLTKEWRDRLDSWLEEMTRQLYRPLGEVELEGFVTGEYLPAERAAGGDFRPMPEGTRWGGKWEYGWFRASFELPAEAKGQRIHFQLDAGGEGVLLFIDGRPVSGRDAKQHGYCLTSNASGGEQYEILAEVYAGHGPRRCSAGPVPPEREHIPEPPAKQQTVGTSTFGIWQEEIYQLWVDGTTLLQLRDELDADSLRVAEIDAGLKEMTFIVDLELPLAERLQTVWAGRQRLRELLEKHNAPTTPTMFAFGHGHLDVAWLWPLAETERKAARTLANQLELIEAYPGYRFLHSQPHLLWMTKNRYPLLWQRVRKAVSDGKIIPDGGSWVEMDTNITGGEALVRQFVHGKAFTREEFGFESEMLWLPDVFGYSAALPQVLAGCGVHYFATAKIFWNYHAEEDFPHNTFRWQGIDGTTVGVHLMNDYNARTSPRPVARRWAERVQKEGFSTRLYPFGHGDGGGGPDRNHLEFARRLEDLEGCPKLVFSTPREYFADQDKKGWPEVTYVGELYYQCHRGVLTSQARTKKGNRKSELALREAEAWSALAAATTGYHPQAEALHDAWRDVLLLQFHDVLPGSSIHRVYEEAEETYEKVISTADGAAAEAIAAVAGEGEGLLVFNSLGWPRTALVELPPGCAGATGHDGRALTVQHVEDTTLAEVEVPPMGWTTLTPGDVSGGEVGAATAEANVLENDLLRAEFNELGEISSLRDKVTGQELAAGPCNSMRMFKDVPSKFDAWDIDSMYRATPVPLGDRAEIEVVSSGPLLGRLRITRPLHNSRMTQTVTLRRDARRVEFDTTIEWQEQHKLLKVAFPVGLHAEEAIHEIQFGHVRRPNHASRPHDADRFEVANQKWTALAEEGRGFAVLNDCKYGVNVEGNCIQLTLLKSPIAPDATADLGTQTFTYALYAWNGPLGDSGVVREAYELNVPVRAAPGEAGETSVLSVDAENVVIEAVKPAEDGSGDVIVRLYESMRTATRCTLRTALPVTSATETDLLESPRRERTFEDGGLSLEFRPFEIKTIRLAVGGGGKTF